ncbi:hypothetical protein QFZ20_002438 [Flavobacterium sp. W4I14]|nr:hypothetical protein [Flavobacterium sp. W4I14]
MSIRLSVIEDAIRVEEMIAHNVCAVLEIDPTASKLFGHTSAALPFSTKIEILQEVQYFDKETKEKFKVLSQIRNKFAHISSVNDYTTCYDKVNGCKNCLIKWYPRTVRSDFDTEERFNFGLYYSLLTDVFEEVARFNQFIADKVKKEYDIDSRLRWLEEFGNQIDILKASDNSFAKIIAKAERETNLAIDKMEPLPRSKWLDYIFTSRTL